MGEYIGKCNRCGGEKVYHMGTQSLFPQYCPHCPKSGCKGSMEPVADEGRKKIIEVTLTPQDVRDIYFRNIGKE